MGTSSTNNETLGYMMLFCALMLVRKSAASVDQAVSVVPLDGNARFLARELAVVLSS
jgi:hypothetical protein